MNFKDWEKLEEDDKTVTLQHPKGHKMTIAVKALPRIQQEMIKRLQFAKGGEVNAHEEGKSEQGKIVRRANRMKERGDDPSQEMHEAKEEAKGRAEFERHVKPKIQGLAEGGEVTKKDQREHLKNPEKRSDEHFKKKYPDAKPPSKPKSSPHVEPGEHGQSEPRSAYYAGGTQDGPIGSDGDVDNEGVSADDAAPAKQPAPTVNINVGQPAQPTQAPQPQAPQAPAAAAQAPWNPRVAPAEVPQVNVPDPTSVTGSSLSNEAKNTLEGVESEKAGIKGQAAIDAAKAKMAIPAVQQNLEGQQNIAEQNQRAFQEINQVTQGYRDYINKNPINPRNYQENMGSGQKVATAIGLMLGGMSVPFGGHNFAFDHLQKQIDRDIDAQNKNIDNQKTILGAYQQLYGDNNISTNLAKASLGDIYANKILLIGNQMGTPQAKANSLKYYGELMEKNQQLRNDAAALLGHGRATGQIPATPGGAQGPAQGPKQYNDHDLRPGSAQVPDAPPPKQIGINYDEFKRSQMLGAKGVPGYISPGEVGEANRAVDYVNSLNQVMREIHKQYGEMWKHGGQADMLTTGLEGASVGPVHVPNIGKAFAGQDMKGYYRARAAITKQLGNLMKGGLSPEVADQIKAQMTQRRDTPDDFRSQLENVDNLLMQSVPAGILKKYHLASGLPE